MYCQLVLLDSPTTWVSRSESAKFARYTFVGVCMYLFLSMTQIVDTLPSTPTMKIIEYTTVMGMIVVKGKC